MDAIAFLDPTTQKVKAWFDVNSRAEIMLKGKPVYFDSQYLSLYKDDIKELAKRLNFQISVRPKLL